MNHTKESHLVNTHVNKPWNVGSNEFVLAVTLLGLILIIGLLGNGIVLAVISNLRRRGHKTSVQLFLVNLAVSDLMVCLLCIPLTIFINFYYPNKIAERDVGFCKLARVTQHLNPVISVSLMTAISIDRYMTFVKQELTCINRSCTIYYCSTTHGQSLVGTIYLVASVLLGFVIPLAALTISYRRIIKVISTRDRRLSATVGDISNPTITNAKLLERSRKRVLRVLVIVVVCFVVCWLPFAVYFGLLVQHLREFPNVMDPVSLITYGLGISNSVFNPFIYFFNVCGKSCRSMRSRFLEVMGSSRERTSLESVGTSSTCSRTACVAEQDKDIVELDATSPSPVR
ncbi:unnamed protein product [Porites lobata]|uniref:G-protein coupled receptors family 1 profile domain-containing protein n=1 Tax=Porites lobata TaxID=104759 RepID=A0ABN8R7Q6_9CNID|nr:unnamed protein product [Porites lobata]